MSDIAEMEQLMEVHRRQQAFLLKMAEGFHTGESGIALALDKGAIAKEWYKAADLLGTCMLWIGESMERARRAES